MPNRSPRMTRRQVIAAGTGIAASTILTRSTFAHQATATPGSATVPVSYPITVSHDGGETTLGRQPERIVALEWHLVEDLLVLGIQPVAIADVEGYQT